MWLHMGLYKYCKRVCTDGCGGKKSLAAQGIWPCISSALDLAINQATSPPCPKIKTEPSESPDLCRAKQKRYPPPQPQAEGKKEVSGVICGILRTSQPLYYFIWGKSYHTAPMNLDSKSKMYSHDSHVVCAWIYVKYCFVFDATFLMLLTLLNCHLFYWNICCMFYVNDSQNENFCAQADGKVGLGLCSVKWPVAATSQARQWRCEWWMLSSPPLPCTAGPLCSKTSW